MTCITTIKRHRITVNDDVQRQGAALAAPYPCEGTTQPTRKPQATLHLPQGKSASKPMPTTPAAMATLVGEDQPA